MSGGLVVANLDCEVAWARAADPALAARQQMLPPAVQRMLAAAGTLAAAFAEDGDRLWTPLPVAPARLAGGPLPAVSLISGPLGEVTPAAAVLAWGETGEVAALRARGATVTARRAPPWGPPPTPQAARRCNDRRYGLAMARALGCALPQSRVIGSVAELERVLPAVAGAGADGGWVLKAPQSASGRLRLRRRGAALDEPSRTRARRLLAQSAELVLEPWMRRTVDLGCCGVVGADGPPLLYPVHRLETDGAGVFRGVVLGDAVAEGWLDAAAHARLREVAAEVARNLAGDGYRGPFGIDAFVYAGADGRARLHPLCEINARLGFGLVGHALAARVPGARVLRLGSRPPPGAEVVPVLAPAPDDPTAAWLTMPGGA